MRSGVRAARSAGPTRADQVVSTRRRRLPSVMPHRVKPGPICRKRTQTKQIGRSVHTRPGHTSGRARLRAGPSQARRKNPGPSPARPGHRACFLGPSPARTCKSPPGLGLARPDLQETAKTTGPGPARPGHRAQNLGPSPAREQRRAGPGRAFSGRVGPGQPGWAAHGQV